MDDARQRSGTEDADIAGLDRRQFLAGSAATGAVAIFEARELTLAAKRKNGNGHGKSQLHRAGPAFSTMIRRREDLLFLRFDFYNLVRQGNVLRRRGRGAAYVVVV